MFYNDQQPCSKDCPAVDDENSDKVGDDSEGEDSDSKSSKPKAATKPKTPKKKPSTSGKFERVGKWFKEVMHDVGDILDSMRGGDKKGSGTGRKCDEPRLR